MKKWNPGGRGSCRALPKNHSLQGLADDLGHRYRSAQPPIARAFSGSNEGMRVGSRFLSNARVKLMEASLTSGNLP